MKIIIIDKDFYDMDDVEDMYKNYSILTFMSNVYVDGLGDDDETKQEIKRKA